MVKILDYYYLVLLRFYDREFKKDKLHDKVPFVMSLSLISNLFSLVSLFYCHAFDRLYLFIGYGITGILTQMTLNIIYNKKRRERLREKYKDESHESRVRGKVVVILYEVLTIVLFILSIFLLAKR